jgi:hypothetical protein
LSFWKPSPTLPDLAKSFLFRKVIHRFCSSSVKGKSHNGDRSIKTAEIFFCTASENELEVDDQLHGADVAFKSGKTRRRAFLLRANDNRAR